MRIARNNIRRYIKTVPVNYGFGFVLDASMLGFEVSMRHMHGYAWVELIKDDQLVATSEVFGNTYAGAGVCENSFREHAAILIESQMH